MSSYSSLLRRSKLASYSPQIDQVYTTNSSNLARSNFGFKRPLPANSTKTSPFVRLAQLDSPEGRTVFRKATREAKFVKQWQETGVGIQSDALTPRNANGRRWDRLELQSRFVDGNGPGAVKSLDAQTTTGAGALGRMPNVFAMTQGEFDRFLNQLGEHREAFKEFVVAETNRTNQSATPASVADFDLYDHAQRHPTEVLRLVERFLRLPTTPSSSASSAPLPQIHPTLALQYATPTPLESALAPPVRGRLLGQADSRGRSASTSLYGDRRPDSLASVLSTVSALPAHAAAAAAPTTFFPDATGVRSNAPGRASFRLQPIVNPSFHAARVAVERAPLGRKTYDFRPPTAEYEPAALALKSVELRPTVVSPAAEASAPALPGTPAYSGNAPADLRRGGFGGAGRPQSLSDMWSASAASGAVGGGPSLRSLGIKKPAQDLVAAQKRRRSKAEQEKWLRDREAALAGEGAAGEGRRPQARQRTKREERKQKDKELVDHLKGLLQ
ncbi:hypothetical protein JCM10207_007494 [Rhodosporidiobolus poonsookiae]